MPSPDRIVAAVARLDPESRALVELAARRGMSTDEIAEMLGLEPGVVRRRHEQALAQLAFELGEPHARRDDLRDELLRLDEADWRGEKAGRGDGAPQSAGTFPRSAAATPRETAPVITPGQGSSSRGRLRIAIGLVAAVAAIVFLIVLVNAGDDSHDTAGSGNRSSDVGASGATTTPGAAAATPPRTMQRLNGTYGHGTAQLRPRGDASVLRIRATGFLRPQGGGYAVWLVKSPGDERRVYSTAGTTIKASLAVPADFKSYRYVEVARAIPNLDSDYSGLVLLRVPVTQLQGG